MAMATTAVGCMCGWDSFVINTVRYKFDFLFTYLMCDTELQNAMDITDEKSKTINDIDAYYKLMIKY